jgi:hypothetical protein
MTEWVQAFAEWEMHDCDVESLVAPTRDNRYQTHADSENFVIINAPDGFGRNDLSAAHG